MLPPQYTPGGSGTQSDADSGAEGAAPDTVPAPAAPVLALVREPVEVRGLLKNSPFACVPEADMGAEETAIGPPVDAEVTSLSLTRAPEELRQGPWSLLLAVATKGAAAGTAPLVEDALLRRSDAALSPDELTRLRPLADQVALLEAEYLAASAKYHEAELATPDPAKWHNQQHLLEAMKVHERRMDRLQRGMRDADERRSRAIDQLEQARTGGTPRPLGGAGAPSKSAIGVDIEHSGPGTSRTRVVAR